MAKTHSIGSTKPFLPGMTMLDAATLEAMRQASIEAAGRPIGRDSIRILDQFPAKIIASAYADERYMIKPCEVSTADGDSDSQITLALLDAANPRYRYVTATNLAELDTHTHNLPVGAYVWVVKVRDSSSPPKERFLITRSFDSSLPAVAQGNYTGTGGPDPPTVSCKLCADWLGAFPFGSAFTVTLPYNPNSYPNVRTGWVIGVESRGGAYEAKELHLDAPLGDHLLTAVAPAAMRAGWELIGSGGRYLAAFDALVDGFAALGAGGGTSNMHCHEDHNAAHVHEVPAHAHQGNISLTTCTTCTLCYQAGATQTTVLQSIAYQADMTDDSVAFDTLLEDPDLSGLGHSEADHRPLAYVLYLYQRIP